MSRARSESQSQERLPNWALDVMLACARAIHHAALTAKLEALQTEQLFAEASDDVWYAHFPQVQRAKARDLTPPETWVPVCEATLEAIFGEGEDLAKTFERYEPRAGQVAMAHAVAQALNQHRFLLAEAGTGVGKSLAYLVPCALWACVNNLPIVISTNTRNLQAQLLQKDIPLVQKILARHLPYGTALDAVVLKGRSNYLCLKRFGAFVEGGFERLTESETLAFIELVRWASRTTSGDLDSFRAEGNARIDMGFIRSFGCHGDECTGKRCRFYKQCFLFQARQAALKAHLVIANHALVFAELSTPGSLLPPHAQVVFDEAHNIETAATTFLSDELSPISLYDVCQKLAPSRGREAASLLQQVRVNFVDKVFQDEAERAEAIALLADLRAAGVTLAKRGTELFETLHRFLEKTTDSTVRYRMVPDATKPPRKDGRPQLRREVCLAGATFLPAEEFVPEAQIQESRDAIAEQLRTADGLLERLLVMIGRKSPPQGEENPYEDVVASTEAVREGLEAFMAALDGILSGEEEDRVYWLEATSQKDHTVTLTSAPLDIAQQLNKLLYTLKDALIFSSATLRISDDFKHIRSRLGLNLVEDQARVVDFVAESPFDYPKQCSVIVPDFLPEVGRGKDYELELSRLMYQLFLTSKGRALALFTSYEMMIGCAEILQPHLAAKGIELLVQSASMGREAMTERFRTQDRPTVLFGTQSFWEGVDVVGDALSCVVIARLPFESVGDPLLKARCEKIERTGGHPFVELNLPQALIRFRQGFGRLIRSRTDKGIVVVADSRIVRRNYGTNFARTLPVKIEVCTSRSQVVGRLQRLLQ